MQDILGRLAALRRPPLLIRAARHGAGDYRRDRHLPTLLGIEARALPSHGAALLRLMEEEAALEAARQSPTGHYALLRHVEITIAILAEARLLRAQFEARQAEAPDVSDPVAP